MEVFVFGFIVDSGKTHMAQWIGRETFDTIDVHVQQAKFPIGKRNKSIKSKGLSLVTACLMDFK